MKFTFKKSENALAVDWAAELPRFRAARLADEDVELEAADMHAVDVEITRRIEAMSIAHRCTKDEAAHHFVAAGRVDGSEERELLNAKSKALNDLLRIPR
jgi:hypothetical protein